MEKNNPKFKVKQVVANIAAYPPFYRRRLYGFVQIVAINRKGIKIRGSLGDIYVPERELRPLTSQERGK